MRTGSITLCLCLAAVFATAAEESKVAALTAADDARVAAMLKPSKAALDNVLSDDLRYAHSNGKVDTKASLTGSLLSGEAKYLSYKYSERTFKFPAPDVALMDGRLEVQAVMDGVSMTTGISYLAVWRLEQGHWKFLAWQSCKISLTTSPRPASPPPAPRFPLTASDRSESRANPVSELSSFAPVPHFPVAGKHKALSYVHAEANDIS